MGYAQSNISMTDVHGEPQQGGALPAQIWHDYMEQVVTPPCAQFAAPTSDPMSYLPFTGVYQQRGLASYVPPEGSDRRDRRGRRRRQRPQRLARQGWRPGARRRTEHAGRRCGAGRHGRRRGAGHGRHVAGWRRLLR